MKKLIYIFDDKYSEHNLAELKEIKDNYQIFLCPILVDRSLIKRVSQVLCRAEIIDFHHAFNCKAFDSKGPFIEFVHERGEELKLYFKMPFKKFSTWWLSLVAEKNTLKTNSYHNLIKLLVVSDCIGEHDPDEIWIDLKDANLSLAIAGNYNNKKKMNFNKQKPNELLLLLKNICGSTLYFLSMLKKIAYLEKSMERKNPAGEYLFVTYFPLMDKEAYRNNIFINKYYEPLQNALKKKGIKYSWLAVNSEIDGFGWREAADLGSSINSFGENLSFYEQWLGARDFFVGIFAYSIIAAKYLLRRRFISKSLLFSDKKLNVWHIFKNEFYASFTGVVLLDGLFFYLAFKNVLNHINKNTIVAYYMENYAWEKALNIAASEVGISETIGIQHNTVPLLLLNHFESIDDLKGRDNIKNLPRSTHLACVGEITSGMFRDQGWKDSELTVLGGLRYKYLHDLLENRIEWSRRPNRIVVALTIGPTESKELLYYVYNAFKDSMGEYEVLVKNHYAGRPMAKLLSELGISHEAIFKTVDMPLNELLPSAKVLITGGSTTAIEGLAAQCAVIIPKFISVVDMCPLSHVTNMVEYAETPEELKNKSESIIERNESPYTYGQCRQFVSNYFNILVSDEEYLDRFEKIGAKKGEKL